MSSHLGLYQYLKIAASRRTGSPTAGSNVVPLRAGTITGSAVHTPGPESAAGPGTLPTNRVNALEAIYTALLATGWTQDEARRIVQLTDEGMAELVTQAALHVHTARLERAMPGITLAGA